MSMLSTLIFFRMIRLALSVPSRAFAYNLPVKITNPPNMRSLLIVEYVIAMMIDMIMLMAPVLTEYIISHRRAPLILSSCLDCPRRKNTIIETAIMPSTTAEKLFVIKTDKDGVNDA